MHHEGVDICGGGGGGVDGKCVLGSESASCKLNRQLLHKHPWLGSREGATLSTAPCTPVGCTERGIKHSAWSVRSSCIEGGIV